MGLLDFFTRRKQPLEPSLLTPERLDAAIEAVVDRVNARLRLASDYKAKLGPAIEQFVRWAREEVARLPAAHRATPEDWVTDAELHALFATAGDLVKLVSRTPQLKAFFREHASADRAFGLLGMSVETRQVFGSELQGEVVRQDVAQQTVSFGDHRINVVAADEPALHAALVLALGEQVLIEALAEIDVAQVRMKRLRDERSLLASQLRVLQSRRGAGALWSEAQQQESVAAAKAALEAHDQELRAAHGAGGGLEQQLEVLTRLLADPQRAIRFELRTVRLNRMNVIVPEGSTESSAEIRYVFVSAGAVKPRSGAIALLEIPRPALRKVESRVDEAARSLG
jgi:hypothetical protein